MTVLNTNYKQIMTLSKEQKIALIAIAAGIIVLTFNFRTKLKTISVSSENNLPTREEEPNFHFNGGDETREVETNFNPHGTKIHHDLKIPTRHGRPKVQPLTLAGI